jgi:hypothetical protein
MYASKSIYEDRRACTTEHNPPIARGVADKNSRVQMSTMIGEVKHTAFGSVPAFSNLRMNCS